MLVRSAGSSLAATLTAIVTDRSRRPSALEEEVAALFDQWRNPLLRYVLSFGLTMHDGEEVIQEVFLSLFRHLRLGKPRQNLRGWAFRVAHNVALKRCYRNREAVLSAPDEAAAARYPDPAPNPEEALVTRQRQKRLLAVVSAFPEQDRCCLYLRAEGLRFREIAEALGMSLGAVSLSLARSLAKLARADGG